MRDLLTAGGLAAVCTALLAVVCRAYPLRSDHRGAAARGVTEWMHRHTQPR